MTEHHHIDPEATHFSENASLSNTFLLTRRTLLTLGLGAAGVLLTSGVGLAARCPSVTTPRQTRGPYFPYDHVVSHSIRESQDEGISLLEANDHDLTRIKGKEGTAKGQIIYFQGQLLQRSSQGQKQVPVCQPVVGALVFLWQANFSGRYNHQRDAMAQARFRHPTTGKVIERVHDEFFQYWGKAITDTHGRFHFKTILPGFYPAADGWYRPPHLHFSIRAQGSPEFVTQTYFMGQELPDSDVIHQLNEKDDILHDSRIGAKQREQVVVEYRHDSAGELTDGLVGTCQFLLPS